jgi:hypothetical protein
MCVRAFDVGIYRYSFELYDPLGVFCRRHPAFYIFADNEEELEEWIRALNLKVTPRDPSPLQQRHHHRA